MSDTVKIVVHVSTNKVGSKCTDELEFDREEWASMTEAEREGAAREAMFNMIEWNWEVEDET